MNLAALITAGRPDATALTFEGQEWSFSELDARVQGGFNRSSQHLDRGGVDGQASGVDDGVDGSLADEVAGAADVASGGAARVLA